MEVRKLSTLLLVFSSLPLGSCTADPAFPTGVFLEENSNDVITLEDNGTFSVTSSQGVHTITGTYTIDGNRLHVTSSDEKTCEHAIPETYSWEFDSVSLTFRPIDDVCLLTAESVRLIMQE
jgi:hypothetical protein